MSGRCAALLGERGTQLVFEVVRVGVVGGPGDVAVGADQDGRIAVPGGHERPPWPNGSPIARRMRSTLELAAPCMRIMRYP
jgi:hypothetical protein